MTNHSFKIGVALLLVLPAACAETEPAPPEAIEETVAQLYQGSLTMSQAEASCRCRLEIVPVSGTVFHFGLDLSQTPPSAFPFQSTVPGALVWIAELPVTRKLSIRSDAEGKWAFKAIKIRGKPLRFSLVYELGGYPTTKSQLFDIGDAGLTDIAVQYPTEAFFSLAKGQLEQQIGALVGAPYQLNNVLVTTVGKAWASMYSPDLPHGDPGVSVQISPPTQFPVSVGPIYFNEAVAPDPTLTSTSLDGGVLFGNLPSGSATISGSKAPFSYSPDTFVIEDGIGLYVASPPHGIQGTNDSPAGQP